MVGELVTIDNETYFIDGNASVNRDMAFNVCKSMNMTLVTFEGKSQRWETLSLWLSRNGIAFSIFCNLWILNCCFLQLKFMNLATFGPMPWKMRIQLNGTGKRQEIKSHRTNFTGQPNLDDPSIRSCIHFNCKSGYDDQICVNYLHDVFCQ